MRPTGGRPVNVKIDTPSSACASHADTPLSLDICAQAASTAQRVLGNKLAQGCIHAGLPTLASGLESVQQVSIQANRSEDLGFVRLRSAAWALHRNQCGIGFW